MAIFYLHRVLTLLLFLQSPPSSYELYCLGDRLELEGNIKEALPYYLQAVQIDSSSPQLYTALINALYRLQRYDEGIAWAEKGLKTLPDYGKFHIIMATGYLAKGNFNRALASYRAALATDPKNENIYLAIATLHEIMGNLCLARQSLLDIPETDRTAGIYFQLGTLSGKLNEHQAAVEFYRLCVALDSSNIKARLGIATGFDYLGLKDSSIYYYEQTLPIDSNYIIRKRLIDLYTDTDQYEKLIRVASEILKVDYFDDAVRRTLGFARYKMGDTASALDQFLTASRLNPHDAYSRFYVGKIHLEQGRYENARQEIQSALKINPDFVELWIYLGFVLIDLRQYYSARLAFEEAAYRGGHAAELHYLLGFCLELENNPAAAYHQYRRALQHDSLSISYLTALANLCDRSEKQKEALQYFRKIVKLDTLNSTALNYVGYTLAEQNESLDFALTLVDRALSQEPDNGYIIDSRGWIFYKQGRYEQARAELERALEKVEDAVILEHLGDTHFMLNDQDQARRFYQRALVKDPRNRQLRKKIARLKP